ncbi:hypothetical protein U9M48_030417 [Paspalum notatum var. saurae]|uniref:Uncharacterized protein n=1 Tax=Paspalum notatum var. saurae TaxID=547442 RepID=A0AAQ3U048_PASNO
MAGFIQIHKLQLLLLLMIMPCSTLLSAAAASSSHANSSHKWYDESVQDPLMMFKFSDEYYMVIPLGTIRQQEPSFFISPKIPPKEPLETSAPTWTTITQSVIVLAMCKYILFAI